VLTFQSSVEKSSVKDDNVERVFVLLVFELRLDTRVFEFTFVFAFPLLLLFPPMLASAMIKMTTPIPMKASTAPIPRIHGQTLRFCGVIGGIGDHCGGGVCDGGICPGP
jgi:hypothetical protein